MSVIGTLNGHEYDTTDFSSVEYANKFQQLIGDVFDHATGRYSVKSTTVIAISTGSKIFNLSSNLASVGTDLAPGAWVYCRPTGTVGAVPTYAQNFLIGVVTALSSTTVTVNALIARGSGSYGSWMISFVGNIDTSYPSPIPVASGGLGSNTFETGLENIGLGMPAKLTGFFEDFCGAWAEGSDPDNWYSEKWEVRTRSEPLNTYNATNNPASGGVFYPQAALLWPGESFVYNSTNPNQDPVGFPGIFEIPGNPAPNYWSNHPGAIAMRVEAANSAVTLSKRNFGDDAGDPKGYFVFPLGDDSLEFQFMFPLGEGFDENATGGFFMGVQIGQLSGIVYALNIGGSAALNGIINMGTDEPAVLSLYPNQASVVTWDILTGDPAAYVDDSGGTNALRIQAGVWYKVRMTADDVKIYRDGTILHKTISGWDWSGITNENSRVMMGIRKEGGNRPVTAIVDYMSYRRELSR